MTVILDQFRQTLRESGLMAEEEIQAFPRRPAARATT